MISWHKSLDRNYTLEGRFDQIDQTEVSSAFKLTIWQRRALEHRKLLNKWVLRKTGVCSTWCFWLFCYKCQGRQVQLGLLVCAHKSHPASLCTWTGVLSSCRTGRAHRNGSAVISSGVWTVTASALLLTLTGHTRSFPSPPGLPVMLQHTSLSTALKSSKTTKNKLKRRKTEKESWVIKVKCGPSTK